MWKKILIIGLIVVIGLVGAGFLYLNNIYIPNHLKPMVIDLIEKNTQKQVSIEKAFYFPFKGVLFSGIVVEEKDGTAFLELDKVDLSLKSFPKVSAKQAALTLRLLIKGLSVKQQGIMAKGSMTADLDLSVAENTRPVFLGKIKLDDIQLSGMANVSDVGQLNGLLLFSDKDFRSEELTAVISGQKLNLELNGNYAATDFTLENLEMNYGNTVLKNKADVSDFNDPLINSSLSGQIDLADIEKILDIKDMPKLSGVCQVGSEIQGPLKRINDIKAELSLDMPECAVDKIKISNLKAKAVMSGLKLDIAPLYCTFYDGQISATASAGIDDGVSFECSADVENVDIQPLVEALISQDIGEGSFNAHIGVSGNAVDLNNATGSGWFKIEDAALKSPPKFKEIANSVGYSELGNMLIEQSSATFSILDGKVQTEDFTASSDDAIIRGKGYIDLETYVDFETSFELNQKNIPVKIKIYDKIVPYQLKYKPIFSARDILEMGFDEIIKKKTGSEGDVSIIEDQLKKGLRKLFK